MPSAFSMWSLSPGVFEPLRLLFLISPLILSQSRLACLQGLWVGCSCLKSHCCKVEQPARVPAGNIALNKVVEGEEQGIGSLTNQPRIIFLDSGYSFLPFLIMGGEQVFVGSFSQRSKASSCQRAPLVVSSILSGKMMPCKLVFPAEGTRDSRTHRDLIMFFIGVNDEDEQTSYWYRYQYHNNIFIYLLNIFLIHKS